jgi:hypothetical protein
MNKIISLLNKQLEEVANDYANDVLESIPYQELEQVGDPFEAMELLQEYLESDNSFAEAFYYFDTYYSETAGRGNIYEVAAVLREEIENELGCFEFEYDLSDEHAALCTANRMVNIYAELFGAQMMSLTEEELFDRITEILK